MYSTGVLSSTISKAYRNLQKYSVVVVVVVVVVAVVGLSHEAGVQGKHPGFSPSLSAVDHCRGAEPCVLQGECLAGLRFRV